MTETSTGGVYEYTFSAPATSVNYSFTASAAGHDDITDVFSVHKDSSPSPNAYITAAELRTILENAFTGKTDAQLDNLIAIAGDRINAYLGHSLLAHTWTKIIRVCRVDYGSNRAYINADVTSPISVLSAEIFYPDGSSEYANTKFIQKLSNGIIIVPFSGRINDECSVEIVVSSGFTEMPHQVKTAAAFITRAIMRQFSSYDTDGVNGGGSTNGGRLKKFQNKEYSEEYTYDGRIGGAAVASELEIGFQMIEQYRRLI
jgi:hypothetical protein